MTIKDSLTFLSGPLLGVITFFLMNVSAENPSFAPMAAIAVCMAIWWIFEAVSIYVTALMPLILFPAFGIMDMKETAPLYTNEIIFLFIGGFLIAFGIEKWNLHKRIALKILLLSGNSRSGILAGTMFCSYFLSMWISNIATTMMLLPAILAISLHLEDEDGGGKNTKSFTTALLLGLAYSSSIGGTATLVGTAPNMIFAGFYNDTFQGQSMVNFNNWIQFGIPVSLIFLVVAFFILKLIFVKGEEKKTNNLYQFKIQYDNLGAISPQEWTMVVLFTSTVILWFFRGDFNAGGIIIPGWSNLFPEPKYVTDSTVAMAIAFLLFIIPAGNGRKMLEWEDTKKLPLGIIFLFGGGFALAKGIHHAGLSDWIATKLLFVSNLHPILIVLILSAFMTFFTEITSNTASTFLILPVVLSLSQNIDCNPLILFIPVVFSASFAFMLPVATPPNTVVFASEQVTIKSMVKTGILLNIAGIIIITIATFTLGKIVFGF